MDISAGEKLRIIMDRKNISMSIMAEGTGQSRQNLSNKMKRDDFSEKELRKMAEVLGCKINIQFIDNDGNVIL
jgi:transcriptional regulator with XRE-family HTH domain